MDHVGDAAAADDDDDGDVDVETGEAGPNGAARDAAEAEVGVGEGLRHPVSLGHVVEAQRRAMNPYYTTGSTAGEGDGNIEAGFGTPSFVFNSTSKTQLHLPNTSTLEHCQVALAHSSSGLATQSYKSQRAIKAPSYKSNSNHYWD